MGYTVPKMLPFINLIGSSGFNSTDRKKKRSLSGELRRGKGDCNTDFATLFQVFLEVLFPGNVDRLYEQITPRCKSKREFAFGFSFPVTPAPKAFFLWDQDTTYVIRVSIARVYDFIRFN